MHINTNLYQVPLTQTLHMVYRNFITKTKHIFPLKSLGSLDGGWLPDSCDSWSGVDPSGLMSRGVFQVCGLVTNLAKLIQSRW